MSTERLRHAAAREDEARACATAGPKARMEAMPKIWGLSKQQANYHPAPKPPVQCRACKFMFPPLAIGGCRYVRGVISGSATCDEFAPRRGGAGSAS